MQVILRQKVATCIALSPNFELHYWLVKSSSDTLSRKVEWIEAIICIIFFLDVVFHLFDCMCEFQFQCLCYIFVVFYVQ